MKARKTFVLLTIFIAFQFPFNSFSADILVPTPVTATSKNKAIASANPGDNVMIPDGSYSNVGQINIPNDVDGTENSPIILKPVTPGGVIFTGIQTFGKRIMFIKADWWVIQDFQFVDIFVSGTVGGHNTRGIEIEGPSTGVRITNNFFDRFAAAMKYESVNWGILVGSLADVHDLRIDHNTFKDTRATVLYPANHAHNTQIDHNYFNGKVGNILYTAVMQTGAGGSDVDAARDLYTIFEYNIIENFGDAVRGIGDKSSSNTYRYNVFKGTGGQKTNGITLRGGDDCIVEGNYFFDVGRSSIRVHGKGHKIINNYFENPFYKKLLLDTPQLAGGRKGASPRGGLNLVFFDA